MLKTLQKDKWSPALRRSLKRAIKSGGIQSDMTPTWSTRGRNFFQSVYTVVATRTFLGPASLRSTWARLSQGGDRPPEDTTSGTWSLTQSSHSFSFSNCFVNIESTLCADTWICNLHTCQNTMVDKFSLLCTRPVCFNILLHLPFPNKRPQVCSLKNILEHSVC